MMASWFPAIVVVCGSYMKCNVVKCEGSKKKKVVVISGDGHFMASKMSLDHSSEKRPSTSDE